MNLLANFLLLAGCLVVSQEEVPCLQEVQARSQVESARTPQLVFDEASTEVLVTAEAALVWDRATGQLLYEREAETKRPVASLSKLLTLVVARQLVMPEEVVLITAEAVAMQSKGANIKLPLGEQVTARQLFEAALVPSANDAAVALAVAASGSEEAFVEIANAQAKVLGLSATQLSNATGLSGGEQFSTAQDIRRLLEVAYADNLLRPSLRAVKGVLITQQGNRRPYVSTNKLLGTYLPILAAKTGYTVESGQNLAVFTVGPAEREIGVVVLGSEDRFQDSKVLVEWVKRHYTWEENL
jgi:D-alanyl-D-alanine carboxypeptidase (penicillin-binding protein 5/6)